MKLTPQEQVERIQKVMERTNPYPDYTFKNGKYKGMSLNHVMEEDPSYVEWVLSEDFIGDRVRQRLEKAMSIWRKNGNKFRKKNRGEYRNRHEEGIH